MNNQIPIYKLTQEELLNRKDLLLISDKGLRFRDELKQQDQFHFDQFRLPSINNQKEQVHQIQLTKRGLQDNRSKEQLIQDVKKEFNITDNKPYMEKALKKLTKKLSDDNSTSLITNKLNNLYQQLEKHTNLLNKRRVKYQRKSQESTMQLEKTVLMEESEMQDKIASINALEAKLQRMQQNYQHELKLRDDTLNKVKENLIHQKDYKQQQFEQPLDYVNIDYFEVAQYKDRKQIRLKEYQKYRFEKNWRKQPPPTYTSKQALIEAEKRRQQQQLKEQQDYELELQRRNGNVIITE